MTEAERKYRMVRKLIETHVDQDVAPLILSEVDDWRGVVDQAREVLERSPLADADGYFTVRQIRERWGCSDETVRRIIDAGDLPEFRASNGVRVPKAAVLEYEASRTTLRPKAEPSTPSARRRPRSADEADTVQRYPWLDD